MLFPLEHASLSLPVRPWYFVVRAASQDRHLPYPQRVAKRLDLKVADCGREDENELAFDLVGVDASIANALRRILLAEVTFCSCVYSISAYFVLRNDGNYRESEGWK